MRAISLIALLLPLVAAAQVYSWKDANGKIHYSDQPPPDQGVRSRVLSTEKTVADDSEAMRKAAAAKRLDDAKAAKEKQEAAAKAAKEKAEDEQRRQDCERARVQMQGLQSGQIRYRMGANGEREALEDSGRQAELDNMRRAMDNACSPRPKSAAPRPAPPPPSPAPAPAPAPAQPAPSY